MNYKLKEFKFTIGQKQEPPSWVQGSGLAPFVQPPAGEGGLSILNPPHPWGPSSFSMDQDPPPQEQQGQVLQRARRKPPVILQQLLKQAAQRLVELQHRIEMEKKNRAPAGSTYGPTRSKPKTSGHRTKRQRNEVNGQYDKYGFRKIGTLWDISTQALAEDIRRSDPSR